MDFSTWQGHRPLLEDSHLGVGDFDSGAVVRVFHGTTHTFTRFDSSVRGWSDGQFGAVNYFTTCSWDAHNNYTDQGPDLKNRIEQEAERLNNEIYDDPAAFDLDPDDLDENLVDDTAHDLARTRIIGSDPQVLSLYARFDNPFILGGDGRWRVAALPTFDDLGVDCDDEESWEQAWEEAMDERYQHLQNIFDTAADILHYDGSIEIPHALLDDQYDGTAKDLEAIILDHHCYLECYETGRLLSQALVGAVVQALGYDAIVLLNAEQRFKNMGMNAGTTHIHLFGTPDGNVKATDMKIFDDTDPHFCPAKETA